MDRGVRSRATIRTRSKNLVSDDALLKNLGNVFDAEAKAVQVSYAKDFVECREVGCPAKKK